MITTSIEQSKELVGLGLDPKTADMCWEMEKGNWILNVGRKSAQVNRGFAIPAWSLSALFEVMPNNDYWEICLWQYKDQRWQCVFDDVEFSNGETKAFVANTPIDAAYKMVCWLLEQGLIKKGGQDD